MQWTWARFVRADGLNFFFLLFFFYTLFFILTIYLHFFLSCLSIPSSLDLFFLSFPPFRACIHRGGTLHGVLSSFLFLNHYPSCSFTIFLSVFLLLAPFLFPLPRLLFVYIPVAFPHWQTSLTSAPLPNRSENFPFQQNIKFPARINLRGLHCAHVLSRRQWRALTSPSSDFSSFLV